MRPVSINCQPWQLHKDTTQMSSPAWKVSYCKFSKLMRDNLTSVAYLGHTGWDNGTETQTLWPKPSMIDHSQHSHHHPAYHQAYPIKCLCWQVDCSAAKMSRRHKKRWAVEFSSKWNKRDPNILSCAWVCIQLWIYWSPQLEQSYFEFHAGLSGTGR